MTFARYRLLRLVGIKYHGLLHPDFVKLLMPPDTSAIVWQGLEYDPLDCPLSNAAFILITDLSSCDSVAARITLPTYRFPDMLHSPLSFPCG